MFTFTEFLTISNALRKEIGSQEMEIAEGGNPILLANLRTSVAQLKELKGKVDGMMLEDESEKILT